MLRRMTPFAAALAATLLPALPGTAQEAGFALEVAPPADEWTGLRSVLHLFGETVEPAAGYVRGCPGFVVAEGAGAQLQLTAAMPALILTLAEDTVEAVVVGTPDGLFRCVRRGDSGLTAAQIENAAPGRYRVWAAVAQPGPVEARLIVSDRPVSALELRGLDLAGLGAPRAGRHGFSGEVPRQTLAQGATLLAQEAMDPLDPGNFCAGFGQFDAPDAVLALPEAVANLAIFARSEADLTIAVRAPDGAWLCNDDSFGLDPAVIFAQAPAGDYLIWVGGFSQGAEGVFDLFAGLGAPSWDGTVFRTGDPRLGSVLLDRAAAERGAMLVARGDVVAAQPMDDLPTGDFCAGFSALDAPDAVLTLRERAEMLSVFATSTTDLTLAVRTPDGRWSCNDDTRGLNPAVTFWGAIAGDYLIWVGAFSQGDEGIASIHAALGDPNWEAATDGGSAGALNPSAAPAVARLGFGPTTPIDPRLIFDVLPSQVEARSLAEGCAGFITPARPDVVIAAEAGLPQLMVYMVSEADGVLVLVAPDGTIHCNDDFDGLNPGVMIPNPMPGDWAVFAGTFGGQGGIATLGVTIANPRWVMDREN